ncbi:hypothetical protein SFA97_12115, partial [Legionella pneumophila]|nr:hypothetical protein [Legionella pneumophila]
SVTGVQTCALPIFILLHLLFGFASANTKPYTITKFFRHLIPGRYPQNKQPKCLVIGRGEA